MCIGVFVFWSVSFNIFKSCLSCPCAELLIVFSCLFILGVYSTFSSLYLRSVQVFDRVSTFLDSLWRSFDSNRSRNYVLVTHGISIRIILARYFRYTIDQFHLLANPVSAFNCPGASGLIILTFFLTL
jgi:Histidine phosphatase superfamily (branch 1)